MAAKVVRFAVRFARNAAQQVSRHHGGESCVIEARQQWMQTQFAKLSLWKVFLPFLTTTPSASMSAVRT